MKSRDRYHGESAWTRWIVSGLGFLLIGVVALVTTANREAIDRVETRLMSVTGELSEAKAEVGTLSGKLAELGWSPAEREGTAALESTLAETRSDMREVGERVEALAARSVDVRSMEALRQELLEAKARIAEFESRFEQVEDSIPRETAAVPAPALAEMRAATEALRADLRDLRDKLGYIDY